MWLISAAVAVWLLMLGFALSLCRAAAIGNEYMGSVDDVHCPHCGGDDVYDWGEGDWWSCHGCQLMFRVEAAS